MTDNIELLKSLKDGDQMGDFQPDMIIDRLSHETKPGLIMVGAMACGMMGEDVAVFSAAPATHDGVLIVDVPAHVFIVTRKVSIAMTPGVALKLADFIEEAADGHNDTAAGVARSMRTCAHCI